MSLGFQIFITFNFNISKMLLWENLDLWPFFSIWLLWLDFWQHDLLVSKTFNFWISSSELNYASQNIPFLTSWTCLNCFLKSWQDIGALFFTKVRKNKISKLKLIHHCIFFFKKTFCNKWLLSNKGKKGKKSFYIPILH